MWAVTSYYNPNGYRRRRLNYKVFRDRLELPLLAIEWSPAGQFELSPGDADILIQIGGGDVMWQKERLLNLAIERLPDNCQCVAWIDCDVVFERPGWARRAMRAMNDAPIVQLFDRVAHLLPVAEESVRHGISWAQPQVDFEIIGAVRAYREHPRWCTGGGEIPAFSVGTRGIRPAPGFAWAARRELLASHPLLDIWVIGGGDAAFAYAALRETDHVIERHVLAPAHRAAYLERAQALADAARGRVGHLEERIFHLWHGDLDDREYRRRHEILRAYDYDPARHLKRAPSGAWAWDQAPGPLRSELADYFRRRREDGDAHAPAGPIGVANG